MGPTDWLKKTVGPNTFEKIFAQWGLPFLIKKKCSCSYSPKVQVLWNGPVAFVLVLGPHNNIFKNYFLFSGDFKKYYRWKLNIEVLSDHNIFSMYNALAS